MGRSGSGAACSRAWPSPSASGRLNWSMRSRWAPPASSRSSISRASACSSPSPAPGSPWSPRRSRWTRPMHKLLVRAALPIALSLSAPAIAQNAPIPIGKAPSSAPAAAPATTLATGPITPATPGQPGALDRAMHTISGNGQPMALSLQILLLMSLLTVLPSILLMMTSFTRIIIVLSILRQAIGLQQTPPNQVLVGLSLFLSLFVMRPVIDQINAGAYAPYGAGQISIEEAVTRSGTVLHGFMMHQTRETDLMLFANL